MRTSEEKRGKRHGWLVSLTKLNTVTVMERTVATAFRAWSI
jgi:hypothetical protein